MKLMVCFDGSDVAKDALHLAADLGRKLDASISVVRSVSSKTADDVILIEQIEKNLDDTKSLFFKQGLACDTHLLIRGMSTGEDLVVFAAENAVDFIIIGIKRRSKVGKMIFGSTAQYVILKTKCPVITVK